MSQLCPITTFFVLTNDASTNMLVEGLILTTLTGRIITNCFVSKSDYLSCMLTNQDTRYDANDITHIHGDCSIRDVLLSKLPSQLTIALLYLVQVALKST